jgi:hypothetical protein
MIVGRGQHWLREKIGGRSYRQTISNHEHYREPGSDIWRPKIPGLRSADAPSGYSAGQTHAPLSVFARDPLDTTKRALFKIALTDEPSVSLSKCAYDCNPSDTVIADGAGDVRWSEIKDGIEWQQVTSSDSVKEYVRGSAKAMRAAADPTGVILLFTVRVGEGCTLEKRGGGFVLRRKRDGSVACRLRAPVAWDRNGDSVIPNIRAWMDIVGMADGHPLLALGLHPDDLQIATGAVVIDPLATIGSSAIEDAFLSGTTANRGRNYGGSDVWASGQWTGTAYSHAVMRLDEAQIPGGTIDAFRLLIYHYDRLTFTDLGGDLDFFVVKDANAWVEGSTDNGVEVGACSWDHAVTSTLEWAGGTGASGGCSVSGTDYDADATPPTVAYAGAPASDTLLTITLKTAWATAWRDATRVNNGIVALSQQEGTPKTACFCRSTEYTTEANRPKFEIEYTENGGAPLFFTDRAVQ